MTDRPAIAFLGIGLMGLHQARNLLKAGYKLTAWNRTAEKAARLADEGARIARSAADAVRDADVVVTMLTDGSAVEGVLFRQGVADAMAQGTLLIDMSSIKPAEARDHAERLSNLGIDHLDAPVSGGTTAAEAGILSIMCGGPENVYARAEPILRSMGGPILIGPSGSGQMAKLANQTVVGVTLAAVAEGLHLCTRAGADPAKVRQALMGGFAASRVMELHGGRMIERDFAVRGKSSVQLKDLRNALEAGAATGSPMPMTEVAADLFARLLEMDDPDHSGILLAYEAGAE